MAPSDHDVRVLRGLVAETLRSIHGYEEAQGEAANLQVKTLFARRAIERRQVMMEFCSEIKRLSGASFSNAGRMVDGLLPTPLSPAREIELAEAGLRRLCQDAMIDPLLSAPVQSLIRRAYDLIKMGQDEMLNLHHLTRAAS
ncbi:MAG: hypothetical protein QOJ54_2961 [Aliidongia sp.]|jgi:hypothetical protein|nr:hypothetical protein [Aliidongia sp.]